MKRWRKLEILSKSLRDIHPVIIYAIPHKGRQMLGWGSIKVTIVKRS